MSSSDEAHGARLLGFSVFWGAGIIAGYVLKTLRAYMAGDVVSVAIFPIPFLFYDVVVGLLLLSFCRTRDRRYPP